MFKIKCCYIPGGAEIKKSRKIAIRCSNCGKETMIDVDNLNTIYQDIITICIEYNVTPCWYVMDN